MSTVTTKEQNISILSTTKLINNHSLISSNDFSFEKYKDL